MCVCVCVCVCVCDFSATFAICVAILLQMFCIDLSEECDRTHLTSKDKYVFGSMLRIAWQCVQDHA